MSHRLVIRDAYLYSRKEVFESPHSIMGIAHDFEDQVIYFSARSRLDSPTLLFDMANGKYWGVGPVTFFGVGFWDPEDEPVVVRCACLLRSFSKNGEIVIPDFLDKTVPCSGEGCNCVSCNACYEQEKREKGFVNFFCSDRCLAHPIDHEDNGNNQRRWFRNYHRAPSAPKHSAMEIVDLTR